MTDAEHHDLSLRERSNPPLAADERTMLNSWLDYHRATLAAKCAGLTDDQLRSRSAAPSTISLLGLVRHMADVERIWFRRVLGRTEAPYLFKTDQDRDADFNDVAGADVAEAFAAWRAECDHARTAVAAAPSLEVTGLGRGREFSLRWILVHMIEEYARHNGHADLVRERIDGAAGA